MMPRQLASLISPSLLLGLLALAPPPVGAGTTASGTLPVVVEVITECPGLAPEEVERQVTIPLEVALAGLPGLRSTYSRSLFGLSHLGVHFKEGTDHTAARQKVLERLQHVDQLPPGAIPQVGLGFAPVLLHYTLSAPKTDRGKDVYTASDLRALQDRILERELRRLPRILDVSGAGGTVKRYEVRPDPGRLRRYGVTLRQLQTALGRQNVEDAREVRPLGLLDNGKDSLVAALAMKTPQQAAQLLRNEEHRRLREIRKIVVASVNKVPIRVEDLVQGGEEGVVVGVQESRRAADEVVRGVVLLRPGEDAQPALRAVRAMLKELNDTPGRLLPGVRIDVCKEGPAAERPAWAEAFVAARSEVLIKITGPNLEELERLAEAARRAVLAVPAVEQARVVDILGQAETRLRVDASRCKRWGIPVEDVNLILRAALDGQPAAKGIEGNKDYDITLVWPAALRANREAMLDIPIDVPQSEAEGPAARPRLRLRALLEPPDRKEKAARRGAVVIYRENGRRLIAVRVRVTEGEAARVMAEGRKRVAHLIRAPYRVEWTGP